MSTTTTRSALLVEDTIALHVPNTHPFKALSAQAQADTLLFLDIALNLSATATNMANHDADAVVFHVGDLLLPYKAVAQREARREAHALVTRMNELGVESAEDVRALYRCATADRLERLRATVAEAERVAALPPTPPPCEDFGPWITHTAEVRPSGAAIASACPVDANEVVETVLQDGHGGRIFRRDAAPSTATMWRWHHFGSPSSVEIIAFRRKLSADNYYKGVDGRQLLPYTGPTEAPAENTPIPATEEYKRAGRAAQAAFVAKYGRAALIAVDERLAPLRKRFPGVAFTVGVYSARARVVQGHAPLHLSRGNLAVARCSVQQAALSAARQGEISRAMTALGPAIFDNLWGPVLIGNPYCDVVAAEEIVAIQSDGSDGRVRTARDQTDIRRRGGHLVSDNTSSAPFGFRRRLAVSGGYMKGYRGDLEYKHTVPAL